MAICDSLGGQRKGTIAMIKKLIVDIVVDAYPDLKDTEPLLLKNIIGFHAKLPQQPNHCDCGVYLLHYVELFIKAAGDTLFAMLVSLSWEDDLIVRDKIANTQDGLIDMK